MTKTYLRSIFLIPTSKNFSELESPNGKQFDAGDNGESTDAMYSFIQADAILLTLLLSMDDRQKTILLYQVFREAGYNLNHADCAKTLSITRERYMVLLKDVKKRAGKILQMPLE